jgi:hypothetical protein
MRRAISAIVAAAAMCSLFAWWSASRPSEGVVNSPSVGYNSDCSASSSEDCVRTRVAEVFTVGGIEAAVAEFERLALSSEQLRFNCHAWMHEIGELAGATYEWAELPTEISLDCQGGLLHGVLQGVATRLPDTGLQDFVSGFCARMSSSKSSSTAEMDVECAHGIGHALSVRLFPDMEAAASLCHTSRLAAREQQLCLGGVLMELGYANLVSKGHAPGTPQTGFVGISVERITALCKTLSDVEDIFAECVSRWWMFAGPEIGDHPVQMYQSCTEDLGAGIGDIAAPCARGVGSWVVQVLPVNNGDDPWAPYIAKYAESCNSLPGQAAGWCFYQLVPIVLVPALSADDGTSELPDVCAYARADAKDLCKDGMGVSRAQSGRAMGEALEQG